MKSKRPLPVPQYPELIYTEARVVMPKGHAPASYYSVTARCRYCGEPFITTRSNYKRNFGCGCNQGRPTHRGPKESPRLYGIWCGMKGRCYNESDPKYPRYGARGITVCDEWREDFEPFRKWAESSGYQENLTIDRIDNDRGYSPDNCQWTDLVAQARNRSRNRLTLDKAKEIRRRLAEGEQMKALANEFGVTSNNIGAVKKNLIWKE